MVSFINKVGNVKWPQWTRHQLSYSEDVIKSQETQARLICFLKENIKFSYAISNNQMQKDFLYFYVILLVEN